MLAVMCSAAAAQCSATKTSKPARRAAQRVFVIGFDGGFISNKLAYHVR